MWQTVPLYQQLNFLDVNYFLMCKYSLTEACSSDSYCTGTRQDKHNLRTSRDALIDHPQTTTDRFALKNICDQ